MDDIRDIRKGDQVGRFLDTRAIRTNPFGRNISGERAYFRAERLVSALHLLTNHISNGEPARDTIRKVGLTLLSDILLLRNEMRIPDSARTNAVRSSIRELISLIRILAVSGFVSLQNADVVVEALDELGNFLNSSQRSPLSENIVLRREDLLSAGALADRPSSRAWPVRALASRTQTRISTSDIRDSVSVKDTKIKDKIGLRANEGYKTERNGARAQVIIDILQSGGELGIRDIAANLTEYSEKMIQRELSDLVDKQIVKKTGVKRWSRYSLVT